MSHRDQMLLAALATEAERRLGEFVPSTAWAFAVLSHRAAKLFAALARVAERRLTENMLPQSIAMTAWTFAMLSLRDEKLLAALAIAAELLVADFSEHHLRMTLWGFLPWRAE
eukprot:gnl/TRDRNA2_/TRDRNA2_176773_c24_seq1.p2 gnl/TRDRNA2_/TRDRNA2_176773_c24~~gnl/TRDRNA2_/TRDRNA2_176773_c24_seq1.p2  ORF type:complete len:113 (-),score=22.66 gnl/TRDRNA2_/TRDRNA2_176773_c24_seq1:9-347(-)